MAERYTSKSPCTAPELLLKLVLTGTQSHYERRGVIDDKRLEHLLHAGKQILFKSHQESDVRQNLGFSPAVWQGMTSTLSVAIPVLEQLCFIYKCPNPATYNNSSSELVAANCFTLVKEIERLNDLCTIARNLLATTKRAQNLAADRGFDQQILKLIDVCVRVTARGFDGTNIRVEERHQKVCNLFKRLLITCLQFLHNFIMHNEHRKLVLWLDLFGNAQGTDSNMGGDDQTERITDQDTVKGLRLPDLRNTTPGTTTQGAERASGPVGLTSTNTENGHTGFADNTESLGAQQSAPHEVPYTIDDVNALFDVMNGDRKSDAQAQGVEKALMDRIKSDMERLSGLNADQLDENPAILLKVGAALRAQLPATTVPKPNTNGSRVPSSVRPAGSGQGRNLDRSGLPEITDYASFWSDRDITEEDLAMPRTSLSAAETLQEAKDELMARLQETGPLPDEQDDPQYEEDHMQENEVDEELPESAEDSIDDEEEDDEDYQNPNDQERGLLTDVPLVLGPTEIEALPMIIQAGIVDNFGSIKNVADRQGAKNMQAVRCHILLAQEAGRNVLRELLIFIAAWDLPDDEFYFKMMVQIMESILKNGLMSHAYSDFGQAKDIISPAQAVVIKILTHIFRSKYSPSSGQTSNDQTTPRPKIPAPLTRVDVLTVRYIFTVFRGNIIPETCALIYLQGQIRAGLAMAEDFPLNLWDMERVYEGVYQFLEFFAVLTENNDWKHLLVEWEIVYDLVTLLKELDASIHKAPLTAAMPPPAASQPSSATASATLQPPNTSVPTIEKPYDPSTSPQLPPPPPLPSATPAATTIHSPQSTSRPTSPPAPTPSEDPSTFEWRNLKKLIVLVLSSLVWKSVTVQTQIRMHSGVETVLSCTNYDGHNPYIKEHAVMCLKFLLENNKDNQAIVAELEARGVQNGAKLEDEFGVRARVDEDGRVRVSRDLDTSDKTSSSTSNNNTNTGGSNRNRVSEASRRRMRRASDSNAVSDLLGERFARMDVRDRDRDQIVIDNDAERFEEVDDDDDDNDDDNDNEEMDGDGDGDDDDEIEFM